MVPLSAPRPQPAPTQVDAYNCVDWWLGHLVATTSNVPARSEDPPYGKAKDLAHNRSQNLLFLRDTDHLDRIQSTNGWRFSSGRRGARWLHYGRVGLSSGFLHRRCRFVLDRK